MQSYSDPTPSAWNEVMATFHFDYYTGSKKVSSSLIVNGVYTNVYDEPSTKYTEDSTNVVRLGGPPTFKGVINGLEIYNPGSAFKSRKIYVFLTF